MKKIYMITIFFIMLAAAHCFALELNNGIIHGYISQGYLKSNDNNFMANTEGGTAEFREMGINYNYRITDQIRTGIQLSARDLGEMGDNEVIVDWAVIDYSWRNWLGVRGGRLKQPLGLYNETRDIDMLRTNILLPQSVYSEYWRDTISYVDGAGLYGEIPMTFMGSLSYQIQGGATEIELDDGMAQFIDNTGWITPDEFDVENIYSASLFWSTPLEGLRLGWSGLSTEFDLYGHVDIDGLGALNLRLNADDVKLSTVSAEYIWGNLVLASEYQVYKILIEPDLAYIANEIGMTLQQLQTAISTFGINENDMGIFMDMWGYYYSASYRFVDWFELGIYYSVLYRDKNDKSGTMFANSSTMIYPDGSNQPAHNSWLKDTCVSARFDINRSWIFKLEAHFMDGAYGALPTENLPTLSNPEGTEENWQLYTAKITFNF